jgi:DNA-binding NarL/FixJ family response regulator
MPLGILIVEDDAKFRAAFAAAVGAAPDMRVLGAAANGRQGIAMLDDHAPDVLLCDLDLPDVRGLEVIRHAAAHLPACDIMVVTVFGDERHVLESIEAGATGYLLKDSLPHDFVEQIRLLRAGGSPISPIIARQLLLRFHAAPGRPGPASVAPAGRASRTSAPGDGRGGDVDAVPLSGASSTPDGGDATDAPGLSERERSVLSLVAKGFSYDEIATLLAVSRHTVMTYVKRIYRKLQVGSKTEAVYEARKMGLVRD